MLLVVEVTSPVFSGAVVGLEPLDAPAGLSSSFPLSFSLKDV